MGRRDEVVVYLHDSSTENLKRHFGFTSRKGGEPMTKYGKKELTTIFESMQPGKEMFFILPPTFGGNTVVVRANVKSEDKKVKPYSVFWGPTLEMAIRSKPLFDAKKAKEAAQWIADRNGEVIESK